MAAGFLAAGVCWSSLQLAGQAACGAFPVVGQVGITTYLRYCTGSSAAGAITLRGANCSSTVCVLDAASLTVTPTYATCEQDITRSAWDLSMVDGAIIGSAVLAVWGAAWAWRALRMTVADAGSDLVE